MNRVPSGLHAVVGVPGGVVTAGYAGVVRHTEQGARSVSSRTAIALCAHGRGVAYTTEAGEVVVGETVVATLPVDEHVAMVSVGRFLVVSPFSGMVVTIHNSTAVYASIIPGLLTMASASGHLYVVHDRVLAVYNSPPSWGCHRTCTLPGPGRGVCAAGGGAVVAMAKALWYVTPDSQTPFLWRHSPVVCCAGEGLAVAVGCEDGLVHMMTVKKGRVRYGSLWGRVGVASSMAISGKTVCVVTREGRTVFVDQGAVRFTGTPRVDAIAVCCDSVELVQGGNEWVRMEKTCKRVARIPLAGVFDGMEVESAGGGWKVALRRNDQWEQYAVGSDHRVVYVGMGRRETSASMLTCQHTHGGTTVSGYADGSVSMDQVLVATLPLSVRSVVVLGPGIVAATDTAVYSIVDSVASVVVEHRWLRLSPLGSSFVVSHDGGSRLYCYTDQWVSTGLGAEVFAAAQCHHQTWTVVAGALEVWTADSSCPSRVFPSLRGCVVLFPRSGVLVLCTGKSLVCVDRVDGSVRHELVLDFAPTDMCQRDNGVVVCGAGIAAVDVSPEGMLAVVHTAAAPPLCSVCVDGEEIVVSGQKIGRFSRSLQQTGPWHTAVSVVHSLVAGAGRVYGIDVETGVVEVGAERVERTETGVEYPTCLGWNGSLIVGGTRGTTAAPGDAVTAISACGTLCGTLHGGVAAVGDNRT